MISVKIISLLFLLIGVGLFFSAGYLFASIKFNLNLELEKKSLNNIIINLKQQLAIKDQELIEINNQIIKCKEEITHLSSIKDHIASNKNLDNSATKILLNNNNYSAIYLKSQLNIILEKLTSEWLGNNGLVLADKHGRLFNSGGIYAKQLAMLGAVFYRLKQIIILFFKLENLTEFTFTEVIDNQKIIIIIKPITLLQQQFYLIASHEDTIPFFSDPNNKKLDTFIEKISNLMSNL